jgi:hypothetical protein
VNANSAVADAHLVLEPGHGEAIGRHLDHERRESSMAGSLGVGDREHDDEVRDRTVADEALRAIDDVVVTIPTCRRPRRGGIGSRFGLRDGERDEVLPAGEPRDPASLLVRGAGERDRE